MPPIDEADSAPADREESDTNRESALRRFGRFLRVQLNRLALLTGVLLFVLVYFWQSIFVTIHSGEVGVLYLRFDGGTVTDRLLNEGVRFVLPWNKIYVYNVRLKEIQHSMTVLTREGLAVTLELSIRYRPELDLVGLLHKRVGPDYPKIIVLPEVEGAVRSVIGSKKIDAVYSNANAVWQHVVKDSLDKTQRSYVLIDTVIVRSVKLPKELEERIVAKLAEKENHLTYEHRLNIASAEAKRRAIEADGIATYNKIVQGSLTPDVLQWKALQATKDLAKSPNAKTVVIGRNSDGLPIILPK